MITRIRFNIYAQTVGYKIYIHFYRYVRVTQSCDIIRTSLVKNDNLYVPNVFSPNGDGLNDCFEVFSSQSTIDIRRFVVFDRWGEQVFENYDAQEVRWDGSFRGKRLNPGVFTYMIEFTCGGSLNRRVGSVTLVL